MGDPERLIAHQVPAIFQCDPGQAHGHLMLRVKRKVIEELVWGIKTVCIEGEVLGREVDLEGHQAHMFANSSYGWH